MKKIIFDTDIGGDCDDVMALDVLLSAHKCGECELLGVTYCEKSRNAPACIYAICRQHGFADIPIGRVPIKENEKCILECAADRKGIAKTIDETVMRLFYENAVEKNL